MRTIGVVTTSRADYGIYYPILRKIQAHGNLKLSLLVTGMHLSKDFGLTVRVIRKDGFPVKAEIPVPLSDSPQDISIAMGKVTEGFAKVFKNYHPDILLILGDRFEMHAAAVASVPFRIPLAHIHGGENTYGAIDDYFRHSLTKLSHLHFATTQEHARRIIQMGEEPWRVVVSGAPSLDNIFTEKPLPRADLEKSFSFALTDNTILATFHPVTNDDGQNADYIRELLKALDGFKKETVIFTAPNADTHNRVITKAITSYVKKNRNCVFVLNFGSKAYLSVLRHVRAMVGNSSSGIIEASSFRLPAVNIGTRQDGRVRAKNVIDVGYQASDIKKGLNRALSISFRKSLKGIQNPYGDGKAGGRIVSVLARVDTKKLLEKRFYDLKND